ncbi:MAG: hypothetical protein NVSMB31_02850 [Vulcanimicrobiaceae bacterium]
MSTLEATKRDSATIHGVDLFGYLVKDPQRAIAFYRDVIGIAPTDIDDKGRGAEFTLADGTTFAVWKPDVSDGPADGVTGGTVMFAVEDANAAVARLRKHGQQVTDPDDTGACLMAFTQDPEGNSIIIHQRK